MPIGSPSVWVSSDDYPAAALRGGMSGTVGFRLEVDASGVPTRCTVTSSSGFEVLDNTTCTLMMQRARFRPALDAAGRPRPAVWMNWTRWEIPHREPSEAATVRPVSWSRVIRFSISPSGKLTGCDDEYFGKPGLLDPGVCERLAALPVERLRALRGASSGPVAFQIRYQHVVEGLPVVRPHAPPPGYRTVVSQQVTFNINRAGLVGGCSGDLLGLPMLAPACDDTTRYGPQSGRLRVTVTQTVISNGDIRVLPALRALMGD
jgi:TonB family protein